MANRLYDKGREAFLNADVDWMADSIKAVLVDLGTYTPDFVNDDFLADILSGSRIATSGNLANKTSTGGVADADDVTFSAVSGVTVEAVVVYKDTGSAATSQLIAYFDTATGLPVTPNGGDITIAWDSGANKMFKL